MPGRGGRSHIHASLPRQPLLWSDISEETSIPRNATGSAVGVVAFVGYTPEVFFGPLAFGIVAAVPGAAGYQYVFGLLAVISAVGLVATYYGEHIQAQWDAKTLCRDPRLTLDVDQVGEISPLYAVSRDGSTLAVLSRRNDTYGLLFVEEGKLRTRLELKMPERLEATGNLEWSADKKTIYVALIQSKKRPLRSELCVGQIDLSTGDVRVIPLQQVGKRDPYGPFVSVNFQIALSPGGDMIVASSAAVETAEDNERYVFIIDLKEAGRNVTKIPFRPGPVSVAARS
jgi:hypothetical protein